MGHDLTPEAAVERLIAFRYLRARREEGFISVIAGFSLVGIALGVGTLTMALSLLTAWVAVRSKLPGRGMIDIVAAATTFPGTVEGTMSP